MANILYLLLVITIFQIYLSKGCKSGNECPTQEPYCFSAGCVKDCPEPFYKTTVNVSSPVGPVVYDYVRVWSFMAIWNPDVTYTFLIILKELQLFELEMIDDDAAMILMQYAKKKHCYIGGMFDVIGLR
ncbi:hypothetical protein DPMN_004548 [Dreissena polymorpha]|uniref:Uncharacterized protein n=1 Tax=Dreissena polymorpha TaxID=45954 RepID=A0A9D4MRS3_DREPO|nr:hypothetical protein DPMN_004548 [Dreissena polymorpha]